MGTKNTKKTLADETHIIVDRIIEQGIDGIIGGFPCQNISGASYAHGDSSGLSGERSGLFWETIKTIRLVRPKLVLLENVAALFRSDRQRDMGRILGSLATCGYDIEWDCVGAGTVGAPHHRARAYILAHIRGLGRRRFFPCKISRQPEYDYWKDVRRVEDVPEVSPLYPSKLCRGGNGVAKRLHGIGNGNPPCVIRELTKGLTLDGFKESEKEAKIMEEENGNTKDKR